MRLGSITAVRQRHSRAALGLAAASVLLLGACGGSDGDDGAASTAAPSESSGQDAGAESTGSGADVLASTTSEELCAALDVDALVGLAGMSDGSSLARSSGGCDVFGNQDGNSLALFVGFQTDASGGPSDIDELVAGREASIDNLQEIEIAGNRAVSFSQGDLQFVMIDAGGRTLEVNALGSPAEATPSSDELIQIATAVLS